MINHNVFLREEFGLGYLNIHYLFLNSGVFSYCIDLEKSKLQGGEKEAAEIIPQGWSRM